MKNVMKRSFAVLMSLVMCVSMLFGLSFSAQAANVDYVTSSDGKYIYNWGTREVDATFLSQYAEAFYSDNDTSYEALSALSGSSTESSVPSSELYSALYELMSSKHETMTSYGDTRNLFMYTDCEQSNTSNLSLFYSGSTVLSTWDNGVTFNREHIWPDSRGTSTSDVANNTTSRETDIIMIRPTTVSNNSSRGNTAYGESSGFLNPYTHSFPDAKEENIDVRGDAARTILYVYVRYGNDPTYSDGALDYMWGSNGVIESKEILLKWIEEDPVDTWELGRNDSVESITGTRNVFVDYPELAFDLFNEDVPTGYTSPSGGEDVEGSTGGDSTGDNTTSTTTTKIVFEFGDNGDASHSDGSSATTHTETVDNYTLTLENLVRCYSEARDAKGNSALKLGTSSAVGSFSITVPDDVTSVILNVAQYKANTTKISVNDTAYTISTASNNGEYTAITVDTTQNKTITFTTVSGGVRCMIDSITYVVAGSSDEGGEDPTYTVTASSNNTAYGTASLDEATNVIKAEPKTGYQVSGYSIDPEGAATVTQSGNEFTVTDITSNVTVTINFEAIPETITGYFIKVTAPLDDWSGKYLIVYETDDTAGKAFNGSLETLDAANNYLDVTITDGKIGATTALKNSQFVIEKSGDGYTVKSTSGYYIGHGATSAGLLANNSTAHLNTITFDDTVHVSGASGFDLQYNDASNALRFRYYNGTQNAIALYMYVDAVDYTVTANSDETKGTVLVKENVIFAMPNDGYAVSGCTVTSGTADITKNGNAFIVDVSSDVTVNVTFAPRENTVKFVENGKVISALKANTGDTITLPATAGEMSSATFLGWSIEGSDEILTGTYTVTTDVTFIAQYESNEGETSGGETVTATISFADKTQRTTFTTEQQVWEQNGITVTNNKASSTNNVADYVNPARFYKNSEVIIAYTEAITKIEVTANNGTYATDLVDSLATAAATVTKDGSVVTIVPTNPSTSFTFVCSDAQIRVNSIIVYAETTETATPTGKIEGAQIEVGTSLTLNYYASLSNVADDAQVELRVTMLGKETTIERDIANIVDGKYVFTFDGITTQCMTELIEAELVLVDNEVETFLNTKEGYSIQQNAINLLTAYPDDAALKQFITDMLYYGAASQTYRGYNTENLATSGVEGLGSPSDVLPSEDDAMSLINNADATIGDVYFKSATVWFDSINNLIIKLNSATDNTELRLNGEAVMSGAGNTVYTTEEIKATAFDKIYVFELYEDGVLVQTLAYSVNAYTYSMTNSSNSAMKELALALYRYGVSAKAYAESLQ